MGYASTFDKNPFERFRQRLEQAMAQAESQVGEAPIVPKSKCKSHRAELFEELYSLYEKSYKKNTWADYRKWLAKNKFKHSQLKVAEFKKSKDFRKQITVKSFCSYWFGFLKNPDLYFLLSVARDKTRRGENLNKWLFWSIKKSVV